METIEILTLITFVVSFVLGIVAKKVPFISNKLIPLQNIAIGLIFTIVEWIITKDFSFAVMTSGLLAGGTYDVIHNLDKLRK